MLTSFDGDYTTLTDAFGAQHGSLDPLTQTQSQQAKQDRVGYGGQWGYYTDQESVSNPTNPAVRYLWVRCGLRDYDSATARWLERDPIGYEGGINVYSFCDNNPVTHGDPSGQDYYIVFWGGNFGYGGHVGIAVDVAGNKQPIYFDFGPTYPIRADDGVASVTLGTNAPGSIRSGMALDFNDLGIEDMFNTDQAGTPSSIIRIHTDKKSFTDIRLYHWLRGSINLNRWPLYNVLDCNCADLCLERSRPQK